MDVARRTVRVRFADAAGAEELAKRVAGAGFEVA